MSDRPMKLQDLFKAGELIELDLEGDGKFQIYLRKPTPQQREEAVNVARGKALRVKRLYRDKDGDMYQSVYSQVENLSEEEIIERLISFDSSDIRQAAYNEILYGKSGSDWSTEGLNYLDLITAIRDRMEEIQEFNEAVAEGGEKIEFHSDEELKGLLDDREKFEEEVNKLVEEVFEEKKQEYRGYNRDTLIERWVNRTIELESNMAWYQEYKQAMLMHAAREPEDHDRLYFSNMAEIEDLPFYISMQLHDHLDRIDRGLGDVKNLLSLPSS